VSSNTIVAASTILLQGLRWETYERLLDEVENPARLTYDRGTLEIVSPSHRHELWIQLVADLLTVLAMELELPLKPGGATTLRRRNLDRGMEPDACFWVQHEAAVRSRLELDFNVDPVPDLVLEAEASRSIVDRLEILADLGVAEVWRDDGDQLIVLSLDASGHYLHSGASRCFPWLPLEEFAAHLQRYGAADHTSWLLQFRTWVREVARPLFQRSD
jgi:Uma2 family endonuclease